MECVDQDPIEVILVFDEDNHHSSGNRRMDTVTLPPQLTGSLGQNYLGKFKISVYMSCRNNVIF